MMTSRLMNPEDRLVRLMTPLLFSGDPGWIAPHKK
jgi:hypothetical protein